jgi:hypothetical protein
MIKIIKLNLSKNVLFSQVNYLFQQNYFLPSYEIHISCYFNYFFNQNYSNF